ncbi:type 2 isopentenyl-diphosphate Delta-isomerase [Holzapfeliella floricola]|uniref:Isopentenyl-diphosphate delta-isomerase n=1 Tax=Holzapfeliella floricola DSM 23037 = JCM 16512 TaxID=1423744 RepID=A0A0R2DI45_9LACO|nr:type 2 isopentenyl-diphosphate Delta-isomerase [Holzapfeliella floricola]KRN03746.1 isopentenyl pyrophosphate isomerase [Holzapfeliella floricola DSM 23037 = JCM 16512]
MKPEHKQSIRSHRKDEHLSLAEIFYKETQEQDKFKELSLIRPTLPETKVNNVNLETDLFNRTLSVPLYINAMSGGSNRSAKINQQLAQLANEFNIGIASGSASILVKEPEQESSFSIIRQENPNGLVMANINPFVSVEDANHIVSVMQADAVQVHVNVVQEIVMPEGDRDFVWLENLRQLQGDLSVPVIIKEVGFGFDLATLSLLEKEGFKTVDLSGSGGTNFAKIENFRRSEHDYSYLSDIGLSTLQSLINANETNLNYLASGGIKTPLDALKCLSLGAKAVGISGILLHQLERHGYEEARHFLQTFITHLKELSAVYGVESPVQFSTINKYYHLELENYRQQLRHDFR